MGWNDRIEPDLHEAFEEYLSYLLSDADQRPLFAIIEDLPEYVWLETALAEDHTPLPDEVGGSLDAVTGEAAAVMTWAEAGAHLAAYCRDVIDRAGS
jgi:hypothetical protein